MPVGQSLREGDSRGARGYPLKGMRDLDTIKSRKEFLELYRSGKKRTYSTLIIFYGSKGPGRRFGFAVPKRIGNAPARNTVKRRLRELVRQTEMGLPDHTSYALVVLQGQREPGFRELEDDLLRFVEDVKRERAQRFEGGPT